MKNIFSLILAALVCFPFALSAQNGLPANPDPNKCYVRCVTPDVFEEEDVRVETRAAYKKLTVVPARYESRTETVTVREAYTRYEIVEATFRNEQVSYQSEEPYNKVTIREASFSDGSEKVETAPQVSRWEYTPYAGCDSDDPGDCQVLCFREYPAQFTDVPTRNLAADASYTTAAAGGDTDTYTKRVVDRPASVREIPVPAETSTITKRVLVEDEKVTEETVPAEFTTITREVLKTKGGLESWEEIDCGLLDYNVLPINYELGSARLTAASRQIIDSRLLTLLRDNDNVRIEISAHTDSRGSASSNQSLSERRAQAVVSYLRQKGISASRLVAVGYGESRLKNRCADGVSCTEAEHAVNRRTEFRVLGSN